MASCSSGATLSGDPVHASISQICMSNVSARTSCMGGPQRRRDVDAQFLSELSSKRQARKFPGLHVATGQIPDVGIPTALGRSVTKQYSVAVPQQRRDDANLGRVFRGERDSRILPPLVSRHCAVPNGGRHPDLPQRMRVPTRWRHALRSATRQLLRDQAISRRLSSSAASRSRRSRLRSAHRPDARSSRRLHTARCSASGPTLAQIDIPRRT